MSIFARILDSIIKVTEKYISSGVTAVIDIIRDPTFALLAVYIVLWGFAHFMGLIKEPITDAAKRFLKVFVIIILALEVGMYHKYITNVFTQVPDDIAISILAKSGSSIGGGISAEAPAKDMAGAIDNFFEDLWEIGRKFWEAGEFYNPAPWLAGALVFVLAIALAAYSAFLLILAKVALAVLIALGPLFIISTLFEATRKFFESWMGLLCNYALVLILVMAIDVLIIDALNQFLPEVKSGNNMNVTPLAPIAAVCVVGVLILSQVLSMASALGGGVALITMGVGRWAAKQFTDPATDLLKYGGSKAAKGVGNLAAAGVKKIPRPWTASTARRG